MLSNNLLLFQEPFKILSHYSLNDDAFKFVHKVVNESTGCIQVQFNDYTVTQKYLKN